MTILLKEVEEIAKLAKLKFNDEERQKLQKELDTIIIYMDRINELNLEGVKPLEDVNETLENVSRVDINALSLSKEDALKNAPAKTEDYFKVPKVI
ncbi:MAG: Asp-tRNA(Asn)/Glu-tRNA(Gln) amidotransferase subunit GatC [Ignavibacteriae bacterium]|nr:MAG: Asp-tRNA(Asn)/Glu-tRNA(Gln) amidotransferase subunit GatC [Ignavibacteriota bacterium]